MELNTEQKEILEHTLKNKQNLFCGGSDDMDKLCGAGLMEYAGKRVSVPDPYYRVTIAGRKAFENSED